MHLRVLGSGCAACRTLTARTTAAIETLGLDATVEEIHDPLQILATGVMTTPALALGDDILLAGRIPPVAELERLLAAVAGDEATRTPSRE